MVASYKFSCTQFGLSRTFLKLSWMVIDNFVRNSLDFNMEYCQCSAVDIGSMILMSSEIVWFVAAHASCLGAFFVLS